MKTAAMWIPLVVIAFWSASLVSSQSSTNTQVSEATTRFTLDLFKSVMKRTQGNVIMSPLSVQTLLAMLQQGARNKSSVQLETVLHVNDVTSKEGFTTVITNFQKRKYKSKLQFASKIFVNPDFDILPQFNSILHTNFNAGAEKLPKSSTEAAQRINEWVKYQSKDRITQLIDPASISSRTQMILANVIYFKGTWLKTFDQSLTVSEDFHATATKNLKVPMMTQRGLFSSGESVTLKARWLELLFDGSDFSMVLLVPTESQGLSDVVSRITLEEFQHMLTDRYFKEVNIKMPRFRLDQQTPLIPALQELGLVDVFDQRSNLEGISVTKTPLVVSDVIHRAEIEVNEEGSEASAASAIVVNTLSLAPDYEKIDFFVNQPFLAVIYDKVNKMPIFVARVANPLTA